MWILKHLKESYDIKENKVTINLKETDCSR